MLTAWLYSRALLLALVSLSYFSAIVASLGDQYMHNSRSVLNSTSAAMSSDQPRAHEWWLGTGTVRSSAVRVRVGGSYGRQKHPILDLWWVTIADGAVHVWAPDIVSLRAIEASGGHLWGDSLRANSNVPKSVRIVVHPEAIGSSAWNAHGCNAQLYGSRALFFVKFWFADNMYHLVNDASMLLWHRASTPEAPPSLSKRASKRQNDNDEEEVRRAGQEDWKQRVIDVTAEMTAEGGVDDNLYAAASSSSPSSPPDDIMLGKWRGEPGLEPQLLFYGTLHGALKWARQVFFHSSAYPRGLASAGALNLGQQPRHASQRHERIPRRTREQEQEQEQEQQQRSLRSVTGGLRRHRHRNKRLSLETFAFEATNETGGASMERQEQQQQLEENNKPVCVGALHWGSPLRPISAPLTDRRERAAAAASVQAQVARACAVTESTLDPSEREQRKNKKKSRRRQRRSRKDAEDKDQWRGLKKVVWVARPGKRDAGATPRKRTALRTFSTDSLGFLNGTLRNETRGRVILESCCQFSKQTPCEMAQIFREADIVIGMHGAGLANAIMTKPKHAVLVELRSSFGAELDIFATQSHAIGSGYLWASVAPPQKNQGGTSLSIEQARAVMRCALALWKHPRPSSSGNFSSSSTFLANGIVDRALADACSSAVPMPRGQKPPPGVWGYTPVGTGGPDDEDDVIIDEDDVIIDEDDVIIDEDDDINNFHGNGNVSGGNGTWNNGELSGNVTNHRSKWSSRSNSRSNAWLGTIDSRSGFSDSFNDSAGSWINGSRRSTWSGISSGSIHHTNHSAILAAGSNDRARDACFVRRRKPPCYPGLRSAHTPTSIAG